MMNRSKKICIGLKNVKEDEVSTKRKFAGNVHKNLQHL